MTPNIISSNDEKIKSRVQEKIDLLINEGYLIPCDDTTVNSNKIDSLPIWFDEDKFKRGQKFFHNNILVMLFGKFCGLLAILACPSILKILQLTNMSSTSFTAYKRYMATLFHMTIWYDEDFKPESDLWKSIKIVRNLHFAASRRAADNNYKQITQTDMVVTQFGFIGFILSYPKFIGIYKATQEDFEGIIHVWRVVGYLLGIEDRFNLCNDSVEETREYCNEIINKIIKEKLENADDDFFKMSSALINGMSAFQPFLNYNVSMTYIYKMCNIPIETNKFVKFTLYSKFMLYFTYFTLYTYQWYIFKLYHNHVQHFALNYIIKYFPFLAYFKFGIKNAHLKPAIYKSNK